MVLEGIAGNSAAALFQRGDGVRQDARLVCEVPHRKGPILTRLFQFRSVHTLIPAEHAEDFAIFRGHFRDRVETVRA
jgi:hypothetical protein